MANIPVFDYLGFAIELDLESGLFIAPALNLECPNLYGLKATIKAESKARGFFKPFLVVDTRYPDRIHSKCVSKDVRGYELENGTYISTYDLDRCVAVPETYLQDVAYKLEAWKEAKKRANEAYEEEYRARAAVTEADPTLNMERL